MLRNATYQRSKCRRGSVDLIVMRAVGKGAEFVDKGLVPITLNHLDEAVLALRGK